MMIPRRFMMYGSASIILLSSAYWMNTPHTERLSTPLEGAVSSSLQLPQSSSSDADTRPLIVGTSPLNAGIVEQKSGSSMEGFHSIHGPLPRSLRGTRIPVAFELDSTGHLVVTDSIKTVIEYFLSAVGEEPIDTLIARIETLITAELEEPARSEALDVLKQYIGYKLALVDLETELAETQTMTGQSIDYLKLLERRRQARINHLSPDVYDAFFAAEDMSDNYTAGVLAIQQNDALTGAEKTDALIAIEQRLPLQEQAIKQKERVRNDLNKRVVQARKSGASDAYIFQLRADVYGVEAAERFAIADEKQAEWDARYSQYRAQREVIMDNQGGADIDKIQAIALLQSQLFSPQERRRLATLDQM